MEHTGLFLLFTCQPTLGCNCSRSGVYVRAHLLRNNFSRNFSSIRGGPVLYLTIVNKIYVTVTFDGHYSSLPTPKCLNSRLISLKYSDYIFSDFIFSRPV